MKFDGYRSMEKYQSIAAALVKLPAQSAHLDGEVCAIRTDGTTSFAEPPGATDHLETARLIYFAFDLLSYGVTADRTERPAQSVASAGTEEPLLRRACHG
jgi:ATP-dependent DNA ligase